MIARAAFLLVVWVLLWNELTVANVVSGALVVAGIELVARLPRHRDAAYTVRPLAAVKLLAYLGYKLVAANLAVARIVLQRRPRIDPGVVEVQLTSELDGIITLVANAVTLTPGTLTLEARNEPPTLLVHALTATDPEAVRRDALTFERLAIAAFARDRTVPGTKVGAT